MKLTFKIHAPSLAACMKIPNQSKAHPEFQGVWLKPKTNSYYATDRSCAISADMNTLGGTVGGYKRTDDYNLPVDMPSLLLPSSFVEAILQVHHQKHGKKIRKQEYGLPNKHPLLNDFKDGIEMTYDSETKVVSAYTHSAIVKFSDTVDFEVLFSNKESYQREDKSVSFNLLLLNKWSDAQKAIGFMWPTFETKVVKNKVPSLRCEVAHLTFLLASFHYSKSHVND